MASTINAITTGTGGVVTTADSSGNLSLQTAGTTVMALTPGAASFTGTLTLNGSSVLSAGSTVTTAQGGTGLSSFTSGGAMYATSTSVLTTGTLPVASGGTGVTTSTGSGANVLGTGPTLTNATITTASTGITFSDSSAQTAAASPYVLKNRLINGGFNVSQYNSTNSVTISSAGYFIDRWYMSSYGSSFNSATIQQLSASPPTGFSNYVQIASGSTSSTNLYLSQSIETANCYDLAGQTVTLSFWYKIPVNWTYQWSAAITYSTSANTKITDASGAGSSTLLSSTNLSNTSTWTKASITATLPSNAQTIGCIFISYNNVVNGAQFQITGVQLEVGSTATPFERRLYNQELANCQRYYEVLTANGSLTMIGTTTSISTQDNWAMWQYKVEKRATPSVSLFTGISWGGGTPTITPSTSLTMFFRTGVFYTASATGNVLQASAEL